MVLNAESSALNSFCAFNFENKSFGPKIHLNGFRILCWIHTHNFLILQQIDRQPLRDANIYMFWYFVLFIIFGVFVTFNMIVGVLLEHCNKLLTTMTSKRHEKSACSDSSATAAANGNIDNEISPSSDSKIVQFVRSATFDKISFAICVAYIISLMFDHYQITSPMLKILQYTNLLFGMLLIAETILRMMGAGIKAFFKNGWNVFDLVIAVLFVVGKYVYHTLHLSIYLSLIDVSHFHSLLTFSQRPFQAK